MGQLLGTFDERHLQRRERKAAHLLLEKVAGTRDDDWTRPGWPRFDRVEKSEVRHPDELIEASDINRVQ